MRRRRGSPSSASSAPRSGARSPRCRVRHEAVVRPGQPARRRQATVVDGRLASCAQTLTALGDTLRSNAAAHRRTSGSTSGGYAVGAPKRPDFTWDEDFADNSKVGGFGDWLDKRKWMAKTEEGQGSSPRPRRPPHGYEHYQRRLPRDGELKEDLRGLPAVEQRRRHGERRRRDHEGHRPRRGPRQRQPRPGRPRRGRPDNEN